MSRYTAAEIEAKWQAAWDEAGLFTARRSADRPKYYVLEMFPYPSGRIHMGHVRNYTMGDVIARHKLATGHNVLHPMGCDAFGMPAENAAMASGGHPKEWTYNNIADMRAQMKPLDHRTAHAIHSGVASCADRMTSPSFSRFSSSTTMRNRPAFNSSSPSSRLHRGIYLSLRRFFSCIGFSIQKTLDILR